MKTENFAAKFELLLDLAVMVFLFCLVAMLLAWLLPLGAMIYVMPVILLGFWLIWKVAQMAERRKREGW